MSARETNEALRYSHLGLIFAVALGGSLFLGVKADEKFGSSPWLTLLGGALGGVLGFYNLLRTVDAMSAAEGKDRGERGRAEHEDDPQQ